MILEQGTLSEHVLLQLHLRKGLVQVKTFHSVFYIYNELYFRLSKIKKTFLECFMLFGQSFQLEYKENI